MLWAGALAQHSCGAPRAKQSTDTWGDCGAGVVAPWTQCEGGTCCACTRSCGICPVLWELQPCHR